MSITIDLKTTLSNILLDTNSNSTERELKQLINDNQSSYSCLKYILQEISQDYRKFNLIIYFIQGIEDNKLSCDLFSEIYTILQGYVNQRNFKDILDVFEEICKFFSIDNDANRKNNSKHIEDSISFCIFNLKETETIFQQIGALCLFKLISHTPLNKTLIKSLFKKIMDFIEITDFNAHSELLSALHVLIERSNLLYSPYATVTLYKALDFLTESNDSIRKLALKVIYDLVYHCNTEIFDLKPQIIEFVNVLKGDPNEEVRGICNAILRIINYPSGQNTIEKSAAAEEVVSYNTNNDNTINKESVLLNEVIVSEENASIEDNDNSKSKGITTKNIFFPLQISNLKYSVSKENNINKKSYNGSNSFVNINSIEKEKQKQKPKEKEMEVKKITNYIVNTKQDSNNINKNSDTFSHDYDNIIEYKNKQNNNTSPRDEESSYYYENQITDLLKQMKEMSDKQIHLIDIITSLKSTSQEQISKLSERITTLESLISNKISKAKSTKLKHSQSHAQAQKLAQFKTPSSKTSRSINPIIAKALTASDQELISAMQAMSSEDISQLNHPLVEKCFIRLTEMLSKKSYIHPIITFLKHFLMGIKFELKKSSLINLNNMLLSIMSNNKGSTLNDEDIINITLLQSYLHSLTSN